MNIKKIVSVFAFGALLTGLFCTDALQARRRYYNDNEYPGLSRSEMRYYRRHCEGRRRGGGNKVAKGMLFGGLLGTAVGGAAGGGKGAGIGAATGLGVGALAGAAASDNGGGDYEPRECARLNRKMDNSSSGRNQGRGGYYR